MRRIMVPLGLFMLMLLPSFAATQTAPAAALDGTAWAVKVTPDAAAMKMGEKVFEDVIMFNGGLVAMSECVKAGFKPSSYAAQKDGEGWSFSTEQVSEKEGKSVWSGDILAGKIKGTMTATKKDGTILKYSFEGTKGSKGGK